MIVTLTSSELLNAAMVGARRHAANLLSKRPDRHGAPASWDLHIEGACGEIAVAKAFGLYWPASVEFGTRHTLGDLGGLVEVRTRSRHDYELILHPEDVDSRAFMLVTGRAPRLELRGWICGRDGKLQEWWKDPAGNRPAFFVPNNALHPPESLREFLHDNLEVPVS